MNKGFDLMNLITTDNGVGKDYQQMNRRKKLHNEELQQLLMEQRLIRSLTVCQKINEKERKF